jgi:hypothetical protein
MGHGSYSSTTYDAATTYRRAKGIDDFAHSIAAFRSGKIETHAQLDPSQLGSHGVRESRDSTEHPNSLAIMCFLDVTGSMQNVPRDLQKRLSELFNLLVDKKYATDPQVLFGAIGDATVDRAPLQVGQFESDNRSDEDLRNLMLEGGGGGSMHESYELVLYFAARKTAIDCVENRNHKGYLFITGDEMPYNYVDRAEVKRLMGDELTDNIPLRDILDEAQQMYNVFFIIPEGAAHRGNTEVLKTWQDLLGQNVIQVPDLSRLVETVAKTIASVEGTAKTATP